MQCTWKRASALALAWHEAVASHIALGGSNVPLQRPLQEALAVALRSQVTFALASHCAMPGL